MYVSGKRARCARRVILRSGVCSISQPYEVALLGEPAEADTQTLIHTVYAAYPPNKVVAGCAPDDEEDAELIPLLANCPTRDGRVIAYACEGYACQTPTTDPVRPARQFGISQISPDWRGTFYFGRRVYTRGR